MFKKIISNRRVVTIAVSVLALFAITMALRQVGLYEGMKNKEGMKGKKENMEGKKENMENKDSEEEADEEEEAEVEPAEGLQNMKSTKVAKAFVPA
jgi:cytochrome c oxidase assembly protein Cox11